MRLGLADGLLDLELGLVFRSGERLQLTEQEHALLRFLAARADAGATRDEIHRHVFGYLGTTTTRAADHAVKRLRKKLEVDPAAPLHLVTLKGTGYRLCTEGGRTESPDLVGRADAIERALQALQQHPLVVITGLGGIGKTTLASAVRSAWQGPTAWIHLAGASGLNDVIAAVSGSTALSTDARGSSEAAVFLAEALTGTLVVLDEAEGCTDAVTDLLTLWALTAGSPRVLVTSRAPPAGLDSYELPLGPLARADALELLARRDGVVDLEAQGRLVDAVGGHPLALEIAARAGAVAAHSEIGEVVAWAWRTLSQPERDVLAAACLFPRGAPLALLGKVVEHPGDLPKSLRRLLELSLLRKTVEARGVRVAAPETVRAFVAATVTLDPQIERFVPAMEALARAAAIRLDDAGWLAAYEELREHHLDLREAVRQAAVRHNPAAVRIAMTLEIVDQQVSTREAQARLWDEIATLLPTGDDALDDQASLSVALNRRMWGGRRGAPLTQQEVARRAEARGDSDTETIALEGMALESSVAARDEILDRCAALGRRADLSPAAHVRILIAEAVVLLQQGQVRRSSDRAQRAAELARSTAGRLRYARLHAALILVYAGEPAPAVRDLAGIDDEPWSKGFRLSRCILRSAYAWAVAQTDAAAALPLFDDAAQGFSPLMETYEVMFRHRVWAALARLDAGAGAMFPSELPAKPRGQNLCGAALLWCAQGERDRAIAALQHGAAEATSAHHLAWIKASLALASDAPLPEVAIDDPVLAALTDAFSSDARRRAAGARWGRRSLWLRVWHRAAAPR